MPSDRPQLTVVTPTFNQARFIGETLRSVLDQQLGPRLEYIIQDAESSDGTERIVQSWAPEFERQGVRWRYVREKDRGQSDAINRGWAVAQGEILAYLNSDDRYAPGALSAALQFFETHPDTRWAYGGWRLITESGAVYRSIQPERYRRSALLNYCNIGQPACFFRRTLLAEVGPLREDLHLAMDYDLWLRFAERGPAGIIPAVIADMRYYASAKSSAQTRAQLIEILRLGMRHARPLSWRRLCQCFYFLRGYAVAALGLDVMRRIERLEKKRRRG